MEISATNLIVTGRYYAEKPSIELVLITLLILVDIDRDEVNCFWVMIRTNAVRDRGQKGSESNSIGSLWFVALY